MERMEGKQALDGLGAGAIGNLDDAGAEIDETEFEDLATFRLKPEAIEGESPAFVARYAEYLRRQGLRFD